MKTNMIYMPSGIVAKEEVKANIYKTLVSPVWQEEKVKMCPHRAWHDLIICYRYKIDDYAAVFITNEIAKELGMTEEELYNESKTETVRLKSMLDILNEFCDYGYTEEDNFIVMNGKQSYGASAILNEKELANKVKADCYLIPSSIHEWLLLNPNMIDINSMKAMIKSVNDTEVLPEERLSYSVYYYNAKDQSITVL